MGRTVAMKQVYLHLIKPDANLRLRSDSGTGGEGAIRITSTHFFNNKETVS